MTTPTIYTPSQLQNWSIGMELSDGTYVPGRPIAWELSIFHPRRWRIAWKVLIGHYDALDWERVLPDSPTITELERQFKK